jgi:hypothetical protein
MRKTAIALLLSTVALAGCGFGRLVERAPNSCPGGMGYAVAGVYYGDSRLVVVPIVNLVPGAEFRVKLLPSRDDIPGGPPTKDLMVTVESDLAKDPLSGWITPRTMSFNTAGPGGFMPPLCVPPGQAPREYNYKITVDKVGVLDPRARVR